MNPNTLALIIIIVVIAGVFSIAVKLIPVLFILLSVGLLIDVARRPERDFTFTYQRRTFWLVVFGVFAALNVFPMLWSLVPFRSLIGLLNVVAIVFYLGPEREKMRY